jgi:transcriptional regulator with XRE-family HTH domain
VGTAEEEAERQVIARLRAARQAAGLSQQAIADAMVSRGFANWSQPTVVRVEGGERPLRIAELVALSSLLGVDPAAVVSAPADETRAASLELLTNRSAALDLAVREDLEAQLRLQRARDELAAAERAAEEASRRRAAAAAAHEVARMRAAWREG